MTAEPQQQTLPIRELVVLAACAGLSGAALVTYILWDFSMSWTVGFVALPASAALVILIFIGKGRQDRARVFADRLIAGAIFGLIATLAYDAVRPLLVEAFQLDFNPYRAHPIFGSLITGRPKSDGLAQAVGWAYHFWNGVSFGMMFALVRPRGGPVAGLIWAETLQMFMMALYPQFLAIRLDTPGFLLTGLIGHGLYGLVLGATLARWGPPVTTAPGTLAHKLATFGRPPGSLG